MDLEKIVADHVTYLLLSYMEKGVFRIVLHQYFQCFYLAKGCHAKLDFVGKAEWRSNFRMFGINVHAHPYCACVFLTDSKTISAIVYFSYKLQ